MNLRRQLTNSLEKWKSKSNRKPLILRGARQVGKTTLVNEFSKSYKQYIHLNLEKEVDLQHFENSDNVKTIIEILFLANNISLNTSGDTLLFIDEIQESPKAIQLLRYFYEETPNLHVIAAGSLLEFALKDVRSFPVGRVEYMYLYPFNFIEFLDALNLSVVFDEFKMVPINNMAHGILLKLFNEYVIIGGMPEVVKGYVLERSTIDLGPIYESIWSSYISDTEKYTSNSTAKNIMKHIMSTAPFTIDQRIKFQNFGNSNYRSREVGEALRNLSQAKIIQLIYPTTSTEIPIQPDFKKSPRLQFLDIGIVNHTLGISGEMLLLNDLSNAYKGAIIPQVLTQELISLQAFKTELPNFWVREKKQATSEVDLVYRVGNKIIPIEIKAGTTGTLKSLHEFMDRTDHPYAVRVYSGVLEIQETKTPKGTPYLLMNLPYYLGTLIPEYLDYFIKYYKLKSAE